MIATYARYKEFENNARRLKHITFKWAQERLIFPTVTLYGALRFNASTMISIFFPEQQAFLL